MIRGLEAKKLIKHAQKVDERTKNPVLTATGADILSKALPAVEKTDEAFFKVLGDQELRESIKNFQKLLSLMK